MSQSELVDGQAVFVLILAFTLNRFFSEEIIVLTEFLGGIDSLQLFSIFMFLILLASCAGHATGTAREGAQRSPGPFAVGLLGRAARHSTEQSTE